MYMERPVCGLVAATLSQQPGCFVAVIAVGLLVDSYVSRAGGVVRVEAIFHVPMVAGTTDTRRIATVSG
jgi:hypothetical protein